jgi:hypothetical protein
MEITAPPAMTGFPLMRQETIFCNPQYSLRNSLTRLKICGGKDISVEQLIDQVLNILPKYNSWFAHSALINYGSLCESPIAGTKIIQEINTNGWARLTEMSPNAWWES